MDADPERWRHPTEPEFGLYSTGEVARRAGSRGHSPAAAVKRWAASGQIVAVPSPAGLDVYPGFCFDDDGRPRPAVAAAVKALGGRRTGWALVGWFLSPHPDLDGARPVDRLDDVAGVRRAARADVDRPTP